MPKIIFSVLCLIIITGCTPVSAQRGNVVQDYQLTDVKAGEHSRSDVLRILGSPTTQSTFNPNIWYYIGQETQKRGILDETVKEERIVIVAFSAEGIVETVQDIDANRLEVPLSKGKTPTHGNDFTFMQQLLGNLGRFSGGQGGAATTAGSGRVPR